VKKLFLATFALCFMSLPLHAQNVWNSKIDTFGNFVPASFNPNANGIINFFTPATNITINRIQLAAAAGGTGCTAAPSIKVTDGTNTVVLSIPNSTATNGYPNPVSNDSGVISVNFSAGTQIRLKAVAGSSGCNPYEINVNVQYSVTP
jgi:hypothetical protein